MGGMTLCKVCPQAFSRFLSTRHAVFCAARIQMFDEMARVHVGAHHVSPKSPFLNTPRGAIFYLIHLIMTSDKCRRLCVISTKISLYESPCSCNYPYLLLASLTFFPFPCSLTFFTFVPLFPNCPFVWNLLYSIFYFGERVMKKKSRNK